METATSDETTEILLPQVPAKHKDFIQYVTSAPTDKSMIDLLEPYRSYDNQMRKIFAQHPQHQAIKEPSIVPVFAGDEGKLRIRARNIEVETQAEKDSFLMPLRKDDRKLDGSPAVVQSLQDFKTNFNIFSESSLVDMDWGNVVVAGSAVVTSLLAVSEKHSRSKKALRNYYHEKLAPASDVDLFLYGLNEDQAKEKIKQIERCVRDALLVETTTVRTKNAITIASQYPTRHVQIVLRIYKSISEILTGFDVDCSCAAFDGSQVWASPRALVAFMTQINQIDLTRRSPSYENRLSKYSHRGFEVFWPNLDRTRIDPTIFERSFGRTEGLARLLILEKLPKIEDRERYNDQRREERGRPSINRYLANRHKIHGNVKNDYEDEVAEWVDNDEVSDYHTFTIPYGPKFHAKKIEKLLYTKDLLLNSEWNKPKDREVNLHRHPAFFGTAEDVLGDCCGYCPQPTNVEEEEIAEAEAKVYLSGEMTFIKDDPGRQTIGSFHPLTPDDWTEMAYIGNTQVLCQAIIDGDVDYVRSWLSQDGNNPDTRDYTGRTPLHLAVSHSTLEVVKELVDGGARIVARLVDGKTALHLAAIRGDADIVRVLLQKSESNQVEEDEKVEARRKARKEARETSHPATQPSASLDHTSDLEEGSDIDMLDDVESSKVEAKTEGSMININKLSLSSKDGKQETGLEDENEDDPDIYDVDVLAWDLAVSALHLAIVQGHVDVVKVLVEEFAADVLLPMKLYNDYDKSARAAILTLVLSMRLPLDQAKEMIKTLIELGASSAQADIRQRTAFQHAVVSAPKVLDTLFKHDPTGARRALNNVSMTGYQYSPNATTALLTAIEASDGETASKLLHAGAKGSIDFAAFMKAYIAKHGETYGQDSKANKKRFDESIEQPVFAAINNDLPLLAKKLLEDHDIDPNLTSNLGYQVLNNEYMRNYNTGATLLDEVRKKIADLRQWEPPESQHQPPEPLKDDKDYLDHYQEGSFAHWNACEQLQREKKAYRDAWERHVNEVKEWEKHNVGMEEKKAAILDRLDEYRQLEAVLEMKGAKTFNMLHPDIKVPEHNNNPFSYSHPTHKPRPFEINIDFLTSVLTDESRARYLLLFEAAWEGDIQGVKNMTLKTWKDADGEEQPPLEIAVTDSEQRIDCFNIACINGNFELASVCMEIARLQYSPPGRSGKNRRYRIDNDEDEDDDVDDESTGSNDEIRIASDIIDEEFTIENVGEVSMQVESKVPPSWMLTRGYFHMRRLFTHDCSARAIGPYLGLSYTGKPGAEVRSLAKRTSTGSIKLPQPFDNLSATRRHKLTKPSNLFQLAVWNDDWELLSFLLSLGQQYLTKPSVDDNDDDDERPWLSFFTVSASDLLYAIELDRPRMVAELMKKAGAGLKLGSLIQDVGLKMRETPKFYQGLSVYGKKRRDWAERGRGTMAFSSMADETPLFLQAAKSGSLECVEWFLSDAPLRCYQQFAELHKDDKYLKKLAEATAKGKVAGTFDSIVGKLLSARTELAPHCCLLGQWDQEQAQVLKYLLKILPKSLDHKSLDGIAPLQIAFRYRNEEAAKILLEAGADVTTRDKEGRNVLHTLLKPQYNASEIDDIKKMLDLLEPETLPDLFTQRSKTSPGSLTPVASWVEAVHPWSYANSKISAGAVLKCILHYSKAIELVQINGKGDTPLHVCTMNNYTELAQVILAADANLLLRENAVGRTPFEIEADRQIAGKFDAPEDHPSRSRRLRRISLDFQVSFKRDDDDKIYSQWDIFQSYKKTLNDNGGGKRTLVTLNEANEVARRLAARQTPLHNIYDMGRAGHDGEKTQDDKWDEVQVWMDV